MAMAIITITTKQRITITAARHEKTTIAVYNSNSNKTQGTTIIAAKHGKRTIAVVTTITVATTIDDKQE